MTKLLAVIAFVALSIGSVRADVTVVQTMRLEGNAAAMVGGAPMPRMTLRIKGQKARAEIERENQTVSSIIDLAAGHVMTLNAATRAAKVITPGPAPAGASGIVVSLNPTGKSRLIRLQSCEEHALSLSADVSKMGGANLPREAAAMMKDARIAMTGSVWVAPSAPGAAEYVAFQKAALQAGLLASVMGMAPIRAGGFDNVLEAAAGAPGLPYLIDVTMVYDGSGPIVEAMRNVGPVRLILEIASVSTATIPDDAFTVPAGYTVGK